MKVETLDILLAEDNDDDVVLIRDTLARARLVNVLHVTRDGEETLAYLRKEGKFRDAARPGLVLLDINMPKKSGLEVLDAIKSDPDLRRLPVVMLTVSDRQEDIVRSYAGGASTYIRKPMRFQDFQRVVRQFSIYWAMVATVPDGYPREVP